MHVTYTFTQSPCSAVLHSTAPLLSFISPPPPPHTHTHSFATYFYTTYSFFPSPSPFLCLSLFLSLSITHSIIPPPLCITPWLRLSLSLSLSLSLAQTLWSRSPTLPWHNAGIISDLMEAPELRRPCLRSFQPSTFISSSHIRINNIV